jgi:hypothetical protein
MKRLIGGSGGGTPGGSNTQLQFNNNGAFAGASTLTYDGTNVTLSGRFISSLNGAASAPPGTFTGTWFTGGSATTTKPQVLIEPTGATSTAWSTAGTALGVNAASGFTGRLLDLQLNGTSNFNIASTGALTAVGGSSGINSSGFIGGWNGGAIGFSNSAAWSPSATLDIALVRLAAGVFKVTNGSTGDGTISGQLRAVGTAPATAGATGTAGDIRYDTGFIYVCTATNTWKRAALTTWV